MAEKGSKIGKLGGPLLGGVSSILGKAAEHPSQAGEDAARDLGERLQGRAAHRASRRGGFLTQIVGGRLSPTRRAEAELIQRGNEWARAQDERTSSIVRRRHDQAYRRGGIAAGKASLVESAGQAGRGDLNRREAQQGVIQLLGSNSWVEIQNSVIQRGRNQGKRITKTRAWQETLSNPDNSQLWSETARRRPDLTPDVIQGAQRVAGYEYDQVLGNRPDLLDELDRLCLAEAISRFDAGVLPGLHEGIFSEMARLNDQALSQHLFNNLRNITNAPGDVGRNALGALLGPRAVAIDAALAPIGESYSSI